MGKWQTQINVYGCVIMANVTNVIEIFRASKSTGDSLYGRVKGAQGALIEHLYLKHYKFQSNT